MLLDQQSSSHVNGFVSLSRINEITGVQTVVAAQKNQIQYTWGHIAAMLFGARPGTERENYRIGAVYFEYENVLSADTAVVEPQSFPRNLAVPYAFYDSTDWQNGTNTRDILRVPIVVTPALSTSNGYQSLLPTEQQTNQITFFAQTSGVSGVFGLNFSAGNFSKVFAAALVATPAVDDMTKDVVFARTVFDSSSQVVKDASSQIGITWTVAFT